MSEAWPISTVAPPLVGRATASQRWSDLVFLHWRVDAEQVAPLLPAGLRPDVFDGSSWVGLIPFVLDRATVFGSPPVPYFGNFVEVNVRLYAVDSRGRRGVVFVSLEASRLAAVLAARALFAIPYMWSKTQLEVAAGEYRYSSTRHLAAGAHSRIVARPTGVPVRHDPLADFLTARWALFTRVRGRTKRLRNHHEPWQLFTAELVDLDDTLLATAGFPGLAGAREPDSVLYSPGVTTWFGTRD
ncbi:YqjF family protein [Cryobacterium sp. AP23]